MFRINYKPPELMPSYQRDFPARQPERDIRIADGSKGLGLMVVGYLVALLIGIALLGVLTAPTLPTTAGVSSAAGGLE